MELKLVVANGKLAGKEISVSSRKFVIGRGEDCQLRPQSHLVSRRHCAILIEDNSAAIEDLGSTNGTFVNGERLTARHELKTGDHIKVGMLEVDVRLPIAVGGAMKPKVQSVQEAATRTVAAASAADDDFDVSRWLDEDDALNLSAPAKKPTIGDDTMAGKSMVDTTAIPLSPPHKKEEEKKKKDPPAKDAPPKTIGKMVRPTKPTTNSSGDAAEDALRHFFHRKKS
jgi:predicted component of type VI protein secretion system